MDKFINEMFPIKLLDIGVPTRNNHVYNINVANYIVETINNNKLYYVYTNPLNHATIISDVVGKYFWKYMQ